MANAHLAIKEHFVRRSHKGTASDFLLALVIPIAITFGWQAHHVHQARLQREAVTKLRALGGVVIYEYMIDERWNLVPDDDPFLSTWICYFLGEDYFYGVKLAVLVSDDATDNDVKRMNNLSGLSSLVLCCNSVSDNGVRQLGEISTLRLLFVSGENITPDAIAFLRQRLPRCDILND